MCLTAKPTCEWTGSMLHFRSRSAVRLLCSLDLAPVVLRVSGSRTVVRFALTQSVAHNRTVVRLAVKCGTMEADAGASGDPDTGARARGRRPQPRAHPVRRRGGCSTRRARAASRWTRSRPPPASARAPSSAASVRARRSPRAVLSERRGAHAGRLHPRRAAARPRAPARERLIAFGDARLDLIDAHAELLAAAEVAGAHLDSAPYAASRLHVTLLLREIDPDCDPELLADTLLAGLSAGLFVYLRDARGFTLERIKEGWRRLVRAGSSRPTRGARRSRRSARPRPRRRPDPRR